MCSFRAHNDPTSSSMPTSMGVRQVPTPESHQSSTKHYPQRFTGSSPHNLTMSCLPNCLCSFPFPFPFPFPLPLSPSLSLSLPQRPAFRHPVGRFQCRNNERQKEQTCAVCSLVSTTPRRQREMVPQSAHSRQDTTQLVSAVEEGSPA